jgi:hypothetical protein
MIFDADPDHIASLDSTSLVKLLKRLALAESRHIGIPLRGVSIPLQITIADGGEVAGRHRRPTYQIDSQSSNPKLKTYPRV